MARAPLPSPTPEQTSDTPEKEQARQRAAAIQQDIPDQALPGMLVEQEGQRSALVTLDIISITRSITDRARAEIEKTTSIRSDHAMISATHAHTGPELTDTSKFSSDLGGQKQIALDYTEGLPKLIAESVRLANERLQPARLSMAKGRCDGLAFNRRYFMCDGSAGWNLGKLNTNTFLAAGPNDPEEGILYVEKPVAQGPAQPLTTYVNFAMHPDTTGGSKLSADWPGALGRVLASYHGAGLPRSTGAGHELSIELLPVPLMLAE